VHAGEHSAYVGSEATHHQRRQRLDNRHLRTKLEGRPGDLRTNEAAPDDDQASAGAAAGAKAGGVRGGAEHVHARHRLQSRQQARRRTGCDDEAVEGESSASVHRDAPTVKVEVDGPPADQLDPELAQLGGRQQRRSGRRRVGQERLGQRRPIGCNPVRRTRLVSYQDELVGKATTPQSLNGPDSAERRPHDDQTHRSVDRNGALWAAFRSELRVAFELPRYRVGHDDRVPVQVIEVEDVRRAHVADAVPLTRFQVDRNAHRFSSSSRAVRSCLTHGRS